MVTQKLQNVINKVQQLSAADQDVLAEEIVDLLDEREWDRLFAAPRSQRVLQQMADEALKEHEAWQTEAV